MKFNTLCVLPAAIIASSAIAHTAETTSIESDNTINMQQDSSLNEGFSDIEVFGANDSAGAGDSTGSRPDDFTPFPTTEPSDLTGGGNIHYGVLYVDKAVSEGSNDYEPYRRICVKSNKRMIIGAHSPYDQATHGERYLVKGTYKASYPKAGDFTKISLKLKKDKTSVAEFIYLQKLGTAKYEFIGESRLGKAINGHVKAYYKNVMQYDYELCEVTLGAYY
ncbi:hypothetical protein PCIT_a4514 [Pseudoalteromonas citrea]|uniref:Uncharacterized protein n=2 Tax=Pseudoalteromonas citrea TaxID=43655 RepID=A0AAD4AG78_9GAMM|nr:hypothetical protein [Pseudoalteromonas citrea]KAF7767557.1 hypothetical protein PCIT_a4514 [Pseudoalteromonas citrea]